MIIDWNCTIRIHNDLDKLNKVIRSKVKFHKGKYVIFHSEMEKINSVCISMTVQNLRMKQFQNESSVSYKLEI